jgi:hypothetical protein
MVAPRDIRPAICRFEGFAAGDCLCDPLVSSVASDMADKGANLACSTTRQAKTFATELENMARRNPLGAIAGAVIVGVLIGMMGRRNG